MAPVNTVFPLPFRSIVGLPVFRFAYGIPLGHPSVSSLVTDDDAINHVSMVVLVIPTIYQCDNSYRLLGLTSSLQSCAK